MKVKICTKPIKFVRDKRLSTEQNKVNSIESSIRANTQGPFKVMPNDNKPLLKRDAYHKQKQQRQNNKIKS